MPLIGGMQAGNAYPSGHLVPSPFFGLACALMVKTGFFTLNNPRYFLDIAWSTDFTNKLAGVEYKYFIING